MKSGAENAGWYIGLLELESFSSPIDVVNEYLPFAVVIGVLFLRGLVKYSSLTMNVELAPEFLSTLSFD